MEHDEPIGPRRPTFAEAVKATPTGAHFHPLRRTVCELPAGYPTPAERREIEKAGS